MWTKKFWMDTGERIVSTGAQAFLMLSGLNQMSTDLDIQFGTVMTGVGIASLLTLLKCLAAAGVGAKNTAAMLPEGPDTEKG